MPSSHDDLTHPPDLAHLRRTGPVRLQRPVYVDLLPPCNHACPAGEDIQGWLALVEAGPGVVDAYVGEIHRGASLARLSPRLASGSLGDGDVAIT